MPRRLEPVGRSFSKSSRSSATGRAGSRQTSVPQPPRDTPVARVLVGTLVRPHGVNGALVLRTDTSVVDVLQPGLAVAVEPRNCAEQSISTCIQSVRPHRTGAVVDLAGVGDRASAAAIVGHALTAARADLPQPKAGQFYVSDLLGMGVYAISGERLGEIREVVPTGANDVWVVDVADGELLLPAVDAAIRSVDLQARTIVVDPAAATISEPRGRNRE
jgi:16S rRNA processing protein RimM